MFNRPNSNIFLTAGIALVVLLLSIGSLYGARWAGGYGIVHHLEIAEGTYQQNEVIESGDDYLTLRLASKKIGIEEATVYLDRNTSIQFTNTDREDLQLRIIEGRVSMDSHTVRPITVTAGELTVQTADTAHMVFYGWLHKLEIAIPEGTGTITSARDGYQKTLQNEALSVTVLDQSTVDSPLTFNPATSVAAEFYEQAKFLEL